MTSIDLLIHKHGLDGHAAGIRSLIRPSVGLTALRVVQEDFAPTDSRIGGMPHLPLGMVWPEFEGKPLKHVATVRLSEASKYDRTGLLPTRGMLYFWYATNSDFCFNLKDKGFIHVGFTPDEDQPLKLTQEPKPSSLGDGESESHGPVPEVFFPCRIKFEAEESLPNWEWIAEHAPEHSVFGGLDEYEALMEELGEIYPSKHRMLGYPTLVQGPWELECQLVSSGLYVPSGTDYNSPAVQAEKPLAKAWRQLLQLDTDEDGPGWMWGDVGVIYFTIPEPALLARDFDKTWLIFQCC